LDRCDARGTANCYGVNVVPVRAPATAYQGFTTPPAGDTWLYPNVYGSDIYTPWNATTFANTRNVFTSTPTKYLCYNVMPMAFTDTTDEYTVTNDPEDPIFYSTCFYKLNGNMFADYLSNYTDAPAYVSWRYNDKCVDCKSSQTNARNDVTPKWTVTDTCVNCDKEPVNLVPEQQPDPIPIENAVRCDGLGGFTRPLHHTCSNTTVGNCVKQLIPVGRTANHDVSLSECDLLAQRDPSCSSKIMRRVSTPLRCYCYTTQACCKECSRRPDATFNMYELTSTPDPTCATGILSADGRSCCSASCTAGKCIPTTAAQDPVGFCCSTCITRPCSQFGPPCMLP